MCEGRDLFVPECNDAMSGRSCLAMFMSFMRLLDLLPRMLVPRQVLLLPMLLANTMGMRGATV